MKTYKILCSLAVLLLSACGKDVDPFFEPEKGEEISEAEAEEIYRRCLESNALIRTNYRYPLSDEWSYGFDFKNEEYTTFNSKYTNHDITTGEIDEKHTYQETVKCSQKEKYYSSVRNGEIGNASYYYQKDGHTYNVNCAKESYFDYADLVWEIDNQRYVPEMFYYNESDDEPFWAKIISLRLYSESKNYDRLKQNLNVRYYSSNNDNLFIEIDYSAGSQSKFSIFYSDTTLDEFHYKLCFDKTRVVYFSLMRKALNGVNPITGESNQFWYDTTYAISYDKFEIKYPDLSNYLKINE